MITRRKFIQNSFTPVILGALASNNTNLFAETTNDIKSPMLKTNGDFEEISWKKAYDIMQNKALEALKTSGVNGVGLFTNANISIEESYALNKLYKAGFRSNNISTSSYNNEQIAMKTRTIVYGIDGFSGTFDDINNANYTLLFDLKKPNYKSKYINISTNKQSTDCFLDINIKENTYNLFINYIIHEKLKTIDKRDLIYLKKHFVFANYKDNNQWEISYKNYIKSFSKYTLSYVATKMKLNKNEDTKEFEAKLVQVKKLFLNDNKKIISLTSNTFNKSNNSLDIGLLLQSIHLLCDKHSRPGCGAFNISNHISQGSLDDVGLYSNRLPSNMYIKYKEHRSKTENIMNLEKDTLNPVSYTHNEFINNIKNNTTKFLWLCGDENDDLSKQIKDKDLFIVQSTNNKNNINHNTNLVLPSVQATQSNKIYISEDRKIKFQAQTENATNQSMSLLWQIIEFSKRFTLTDVYKKVKVDETQALKNVLSKYILSGYSKNDTIYKILFNNSKLRLFTKSYSSNTEMNGDNRNIIGTDGGVFLGYGYNIQEYLFNEYRQFTLLNAHDLLRYDKYVNSTLANIWPVYNGKSIRYRFNPIDDIYAKKSIKDNRVFSFYGKMKEKNLSFGNLKKVTNENNNKKTFKYRAKIFTSTI